jgi:hypothetical protein
MANSKRSFAACYFDLRRDAAGRAVVPKEPGAHKLWWTMWALLKAAGWLHLALEGPLPDELRRHAYDRVAAYTTAQQNRRVLALRPQGSTCCASATRITCSTQQRVCMKPSIITMCDGPLGAPIIPKRRKLNLLWRLAFGHSGIDPLQIRQGRGCTVRKLGEVW